jgi:hypothetical protein
MAAHIPTKQIIDHLKTVDSFSVNNAKKTKDYAITDEFLKIKDHIFPFDFFDLAAVTRESFFFADEDKTMYEIQCYDINGFHMEHPDWSTEPFDEGRVRNA